MSGHIVMVSLVDTDEVQELERGIVGKQLSKRILGHS